MCFKFYQFLLFYLWQISVLNGEIESVFNVSENAPPGYRIGWVFNNEPFISDDPTNFLIVFPEPGSQAERVFIFIIILKSNHKN